MTAREIDQIWAELRSLQNKVDRLMWIIIASVAAIGGPPLVDKIVGLVG